MLKVLVIAPHADDETLGCGGTLLRHIAEGDRVFWAIVTTPQEQAGFSLSMVKEKKRQIDVVAKLYGFAGVFPIGLAATELLEIPRRETVQEIKTVIDAVTPEIVYIPSRFDAHTDHQVVFDATVAASKWFRSPSIRELLCYETLSETNFSLGGSAFNPNLFLDISPYLKLKQEILGNYVTEISEHPFPRNLRAIRALAELRGSQSGFIAAEGFEIIFQRR